MRVARILCLIGLILAWAAPQAAAFDGNTDVIGRRGEPLVRQLSRGWLPQCLTAGNKVTSVSCNANNWCRIS